MKDDTNVGDALKKAAAKKVQTSKFLRTAAAARAGVIVVPLPPNVWAIITSALRRKMRSFTNAGDFGNARVVYDTLNEIDRAVKEYQRASK